MLISTLVTLWTALVILLVGLGVSDARRRDGDTDPPPHSKTRPSRAEGQADSPGHLRTPTV